jgi:hypothetical protein
MLATQEQILTPVLELDMTNKGIITGSGYSPAEIISDRVISLANDAQRTLLSDLVRRSVADGHVDKEETGNIDSTSALIAGEILGINSETTTPSERLRLLRMQAQLLQDTTDILHQENVVIPNTATLPLDRYLNEADKLQEQMRKKREAKPEPTTWLGRVARQLWAIPEPELGS